MGQIGRRAKVDDMQRNSHWGRMLSEGLKSLANRWGLTLGEGVALSEPCPKDATPHRSHLHAVACFGIMGAGIQRPEIRMGSEF
jgi:hypothetical protein